MTVSISTQARNDAGDSIVDLLDAGSANPNGYLEIRTGSKPASPQVAATGTLLATLNLSNPAFANFTNGQAFANTIADDTDIDDTGTAGWFRMYDRDGTAVIDGEVTETGSGGDIEFDATLFVKGGTVSITSLLAVMPA
jgi:hypothetical protein